MENIKRYWFIPIIGLVFIVALIIVQILNAKETSPDWTPILPSERPEDQSEDSLAQIDQEPQTIMVDIQGEINEPGVYVMDESARVIDVIEKASGFTDQAATFAVNLAQKVYDEMQIIVPDMGEAGAYTSPQQQHHKVRVNIASQDELETLTGIGPAKAKAILKHREEYGHFQSINDLLDIPGIADKTLEIIKDEIQVP